MATSKLQENKMNDQNVSWKPIPNAKGYEVSNHGEVRTYLKRGNISESPQRILKPSASNRRKGVNIKINGKFVYRRIATLIMLAFVGPPPDAMEICHNDGNSMNDHLYNLRYDTHLNNMRDATRHNAKPSGGEVKTAKFSNNQAILIRELHFASPKLYSYQMLGRKYNAPSSVIRKICIGQSYKRAGGPTSESNTFLSEEDAQKILILRSEGKTLKEIGTVYNKAESTISRAIKRFNPGASHET